MMVLSPNSKSTRMEHHHCVSDADLDVYPSPPHSYWVAVAARIFPALTTVSKAKRERKAGRLLLNGDAKASTNTPARIGDRITLRVENDSNTSNSFDEESAPSKSRQRWAQVCEHQGLRVVYDGDHIAVIVKPVGIHVNGRGWRTVEYALPEVLRSSAGRFADCLPVPHSLHRLDYRVGGLLLVAKTRSSEVSLAKQFELHRVVKRYRAIVVGRLDLDSSGLLTSVQSEGAKTLNVSFVDQEIRYIHDLQGGREAITAVSVRMVTASARYGWITTVDLWPITGRKHQLRIHMATLGHPIIGDDLYHEERHDQDVVRGQGIFLHAVQIDFDDSHGNRRSFSIEEPHKFDRFRYFCALNRQKQIDRLH